MTELHFLYSSFCQIDWADEIWEKQIDQSYLIDTRMQWPTFAHHICKYIFMK